MDMRQYSTGNSLNAETLKELDATEIETEIKDVYEKIFDDEAKAVVQVEHEGILYNWILNKTNAGALIKKYGSESDEWKGKKVKIVLTTTDMGGKTVDCLRTK